MKDFPQLIRELALDYPDSSEGTACTRAAYKAGKKSFAFVDVKDEHWTLMVKLGASLANAEHMAAEKPDNFSVGQHGWTTLKFDHGRGPTLKLLKNWLDESFRLLATKKLVAQLDATD